MVRPSDLLLVFMYWLDQRRSLFGAETFGLELERFECMREAASKVLRHVGVRLSVQSLVGLWSDLTTLRLLCQCPKLNCQESQWPLDNIPDEWHFIADSVPVPLVSKPLMTLRGMSWARITADELSASVKLLDIICKDCEDQDLPLGSVCDMRELLEDLLLILRG